MATRDDYPGCWSCRPLCLCLHFAHFLFKPNGSSLYTLAGLSSNAKHGQDDLNTCYNQEMQRASLKSQHIGS